MEIIRKLLCLIQDIVLDVEIKGSTGMMGYSVEESEHWLPVRLIPILVASHPLDTMVLPV